MIRQREDLYFYFFTKRIHRFEQCIPSDWGNGYDPVNHLHGLADAEACAVIAMQLL